MEKVKDFINYLEFEKNFSKHTVINYEKDLTMFFEVIKKDVSDISVNDVRDYLAFLHDKKYSNASVSRKISSLKSFFKYLEASEVISSNPLALISNPKKEKKLPSYLNYEDLEKLLSIPDVNTKEGKRDALILELLYSTGIRVSELCNIKMADVNFSEHKILILGKGNKERYTYYGSKCDVLLRDYIRCVRSDISEYLVQNKHGNRLNERTVRLIVSNNLRKSGIEVHVSPHTLRHTYATHMLNDGADLKSVGELLGHENLSTTQIYTHVSNERLRNVYLKAHPRAKKR